MKEEMQKQEEGEKKKQKEEGVVRRKDEQVCHDHQLSQLSHLAGIDTCVFDHVERRWCNKYARRPRLGHRTSGRQRV